MAGDTEDLVLSISADVRQMQRALDRMIKDSKTATDAVVRNIDNIGKGGDAAFGRLADGSTRASAAAASAGKRIGVAMAASRVQTANLAAQLNDVGVQLAGGQSPFLIAVQQGTQITQALGQTGARGAVSALMGAFTSLLNPVGLATIAIVGLGGAAIQYITSLITGGEDANRTIEEQEKLVRSVVSAWGGAVPELQSYLAELGKLKEINDAIQATKDFQANQYAPLKESIEDINVRFADFKQSLMDVGQMDAVGPLNDAFQELRTKIDENKASGADAEIVLSLLGDTMVSGVRGADDLSTAVANLIGKLNGVSEASNAAQSSLESLLATQVMKTPLGALTPLTSNGGQFMDPAQQQQWTANNTKSQTQLAAAKSSRGGSRKAAISEADREREAVRKLIEQLEFERSLIGMTDVEREKANALRRAGAAATDEQRAKIASLVEASYQEKAAHEAAEDAIKRQKDAMEQLGQIGMDAINGIVNAFEDGKISGEEMIQIALRLAQSLAQMKDIGSVFGGSSSGAGGLLSLVSSLFGFADGGIVKRATGGYVSGPGSSRSDSIPARLSNGEYVVNAAATKKHRALLEAINSGAGYANGGLVGMPTIPTVQARSVSQPQQITLHLVGEEGEMFTPRVRSISGQTAGVVVQQARPQLSKDAVNSVQSASRNRPGLFR